MNTDKKLITLQEAARLYSVSYSVLHHAVKSEALPSIRPTRTHLVAPDDVMAWLRDLSDKRAED